MTVRYRFVLFQICHGIMPRRGEGISWGVGFLECYSIRSLVPKPFLSGLLFQNLSSPKLTKGGEARVVASPHFCRLKRTVIVHFGEVRAAVCMLNSACGWSMHWMGRASSVVYFPSDHMTRSLLSALVCIDRIRPILSLLRSYVTMSSSGSCM